LLFTPKKFLIFIETIINIYNNYHYKFIIIINTFNYTLQKHPSFTKFLFYWIHISCILIHLLFIICSLSLWFDLLDLLLSLYLRICCFFWINNVDIYILFFLIFLLFLIYLSYLIHFFNLIFLLNYLYFYNCYNHFH